MKECLFLLITGSILNLGVVLSYSLYDFIGNLGVFFIIISYLLLQLNKIKSDDIKYSVMNLVGAALVIIFLIENFNMSAFVIEAFWVGISLVGILKFLKRKSLGKVT